MLEFYVVNGVHTPRRAEDAVYFDLDSDVLTTAAQGVLDRLFGDWGVAAKLSLNGTASDDECLDGEGDRGDRLKALINQRNTNVLKYLRAKGWDAESAAKVESPNSAPSDDPREVRRVELRRIRTGPVIAHTREPAHQPATTRMRESITQAAALVQTARDHIVVSRFALTSASTVTEEEAARRRRVEDLAKSMFGASVNLRGLRTKLDNMYRFMSRFTEDAPAETSSVSVKKRKNAPSEPAPQYRYMSRGGTRLANAYGENDEAIVTFGPEFDGEERDKRLFTMIHECSHAFAGTEDYSYIYRRLCLLLDPETAVRNADSFALFVMQAADPGYTNDSEPDRTDFATGFTADTETRKAVALAVAKAESYLGFAAHDVVNAYRTGWEHLFQSGDWEGHYQAVHAVLRDAFGEDHLHASIAVNDHIVLAGMQLRMRSTRDLLNHDISVADGEAYAYDPMHRVLTIPATAFMEATDGFRTRSVIRALAAANPAVAASQRDSYATAVMRLADRFSYGRYRASSTTSSSSSSTSTTSTSMTSLSTTTTTSFSSSSSSSMLLDTSGKETVKES